MLVHWFWSMVRHGWSEMKFAMEGDDDGGSAEQRIGIVWSPNCETEDDDDDDDDHKESSRTNVYQYTT